ncbi:MAG: hypothetical protein K0V04_39410 [Deltaproteobacteria bacterium]|nr:hypothetical protein [Deltaproteobacteria bacterium]
MDGTFWHRGERYSLYPAHRPPQAEARLVPVRRADAISLLRMRAAEGEPIGDAFPSNTLMPPATARDRDGATRAQLTQLDEGRLVLWQAVPVQVTTRGDAHYERQDPAGVFTERDWLELVLVDENGDPVRDASYEVILPDGSMRIGSLDAQGRARLRDIPSGACEVRFPALGPDEWQAA